MPRDILDRHQRVDFRTDKVRLISVGFGEAAIAVDNAAVLISPEEPLLPGHSPDAVPAAA